jgi:hypothetical protein
VALAAGALVAVLVTGGNQTAVPSVAGKPLATAEATLASDGFRWAVVHLDRGISVERPPGIVLRQTPAPNAHAASGSIVHLSVWLTLTNGPNVKVPNLARLDEWQAYNAVVDRGLTAIVRGPPRGRSSSYQFWTIVSQSPAPGTSLPIGLGRVTLTMQEPPAVQVLARIPAAECAFVRGPGVHLIAAFVITSAQLRRPPITDGGPLGRQAPGSEWRMCYVAGRNVDPSFGGPTPLVLPGRRHEVFPPPTPSGPRRAVNIYYRGGSIAEVVGMTTFRFVAVEGNQPAWRYPWLSEAQF